MDRGMRCPVCGHVLPPAASAGVAGAGSPHPFCSPRCRAIDLGRWLTESYRIPGPSVQEEAEGLPDLEGLSAEQKAALAEEDPC